MAMDEINAAGGINGRMLELVVEDSKCNAQDAINAYNKLTDVDGMRIILGTSCSGAMLGVAPLAEADGVVLFSGLASNPDIANAGDYIFRTQISDIEVGINTGNVLWADGIRKLATITEKTDYAEGVRRTSVAQFEKKRRRGHCRRAICIRHHGLQDTANEALRGESGRAPRSASVRIRCRRYRQAGPGAGLPGPDLWRNDHGGDDRPGRSRRRRDRSEGYHRRSRPRQREGPGSSRQLQGALQLHHSALAPGLRLRRRIHRGRVSQADQRRPECRRIPRLSVRDHLERRSWEQL